jgi:hypothetical protein
MQKRNIERTAAKYVRLIERCLPRVFRGPSRGRNPRATDFDLSIRNLEEKEMQRLVILIIAILTFCGIAPSAMAQTVDESRLSGRRADATVSFGLWQTDPPLDRFAGNPAMGAGNHHEVIPNVSRIDISRKDSGGVNFIISSNHVVAIYDDGTRPEDIDPNLLVPGITTAGGVIDDPDKRIYRGANETAPTGARDRVEVVHFSKPGTYLVICAIRNHFVNDGMYGFVVVREDQLHLQ